MSVNPERSNSFAIAAAPTLIPFIVFEKINPLMPDGIWKRPVPVTPEKLRIVLS